MKTKVLLVKADEDPMKGVENPKPNQIYKNTQISIEERCLGLVNPDEIRVEMLYVGICGTDVHLTTNNPETGYICCTAPLSIPKEGRIIGHEGVGKVLEVGANVKNIKPDMYVTFESILVCNTCDVCRKGHFNQCRNALLLGLEKDGLLGTVVDVPAKLAHNITDYVKNEQDLIAVACVEPAGVAYVACENAMVKGGDVVVVFGGGPIGAFSAILSKIAFGASEVYLVEPLKYRRDFARKWADRVYDIEEFFEICPPSVDVVIESSGNLDNVKKIFHKINANGHVVLLARSGNPLSITDVDYMITNEINLKGSRGHLCGAFSSILNLYKAGRLDLGEVVTTVVDGLEEVNALLENSEEIQTNNCKVIVNLTKK
ncbi:MAG TPA: alcohol dehydrogenase catalytic domain-containing protein [Methylomusa anaerophila]|uniref:L-threonine 3-dehydrogenase n=1 Tax=Methylomusa anaerophila TaxID=1930071 RepID=A0A348ANF1_9FIRM|nr:alcohol dehydrogenase catalytic domain-containing protein [Methylomusa anaerophila]BBB92599.1 L-threonine 3-dehydrogenase [Methylomusa anaerophila]HML87547.1 alcohol dehydrogenase catalytic domain-containing protein [Methylomusa anaerophila]